MARHEHLARAATASRRRKNYPPMLDLDYSDSDASDSEQHTGTAPPPPTATSGLFALLPKPKSRKHRDATAAATDRDAPKKIVVNLPKLDKEDEDDRPAKKARTGGLSALSALLPAPKRSGTAAKNAGDAVATGAAAASAGGPPESGGGAEGAAERALPEANATSASNTAFVPQSVARKPIQPMSAFRKKGPAGPAAKPKAELARPRGSLFGSGWLKRLSSLGGTG